jgi:hypothetical protein
MSTIYLLSALLALLFYILPISKLISIDKNTKKTYEKLDLLINKLENTKKV